MMTELEAPMIVRQLNVQDAARYQALRLRGLQESPTAFSSSYAQEVDRLAAEIAARVTPAADGSRCVFGAFAGEELAGLLAFVRPPSEKIRHCAELFGMYVAPEFRRRGFGRALVAAAVDHARALPGLRQIKLSVNAANTPARDLYEAFGFTHCGTEPEAIFVDGCYYDDGLYVLRLPEAG
jgi:ribosomal protein S18 acetylase RimI-like enzyme